MALLRARRGDTYAGICTLDRRGESRTISYAQLHDQAVQLCAGLLEAGLQAGDRVVLQLPAAHDTMVAFWGCILAGVVPVPLNSAPFYDRPNGQADRLVAALVNFRCRAVLTAPELAQPISTLLATGVAADRLVVNIEDCLAAGAAGAETAAVHTPAPDAPAAMFLTSGSTGAAKGVVQSHAAMLAMADATIQMNGFTAADVTLNWMSLDHAGSLVFLCVMPLALGARQVHVPIDYVLKEPTRWLDLIDTWRASITWAPNFVFALLLDREQQLATRSWDLSCMRFMVNAGEAVVSATARRFIALLQRFGLPDTALRPAFGMVETCSGITWSRGFRLEDTADSDLFVSLGPVIPGADLKIVDDAGATVTEGREGRLLLKGPSVFAGYEGDAQANAGVIVDGWLVTGDLAFIKDGELYVTGREKDMMIINGNNHYCHEIEAVVATSREVAGDCVAATSVRGAGDNTESLVIFYAAAEGQAGDRATLEKVLRADLSRATGLAPKAFVALQPEDFPRTEIGKIKRSVLKRRYEAGEFRHQANKMTAEPARAVIDTAPASAAYRDLLSGITAIWQRALGLQHIGHDDTFFELGGSSLLAIQVQHELELLLGHDVSMAELFDTPTIRSMAKHFSGRGTPAHRYSDETGRSAQAGSGDIAVIGIGCRFPGAHGPEAFWRVLDEGRETLTFFTPEQAIAAGVPHERAYDPAQVNVAPVLDDVEGCDIDFWKYARREAELLDPQQRVFLETAWEAFEDAGYVPGSALGKVGVYASAATNTYLQNNVYANSAWVAANGGNVFTVNSLAGFNVMVANDKDYLPTRVSYKLDLTGPSMSIQTACSSTLVAVHEAVRALRAGECDMAIAGGCALMLPQFAGHYYDEGMINSPDGHCRAYDSAAQGTIFGSGSGAVLLKPLARALADGDAIHAVIKGSAVVNDGGQKMGFAAPSMLGEYRAIAQALEDAAVAPDSIGFVEGHGTGTPIGDPIEVQALTKAFRHGTQRNGFCALGSVKTNIGHMGIASGIAGFIKAVLALRHKTLPATLHFQKANPAIAIDRTPFYVSNRTSAWPAGETPRRAGVNSLGIGGTNVHVILEEARAPKAVVDDVPLRAAHGIHVVPVSAGNTAALAEALASLAAFVERHPEVPLADVAFTQQRGRLAMAARMACVVADRDELLSWLRSASTAPPLQATAVTGAKLVFMFAGQGCQYVGMGRELYDSHPAFRAALDACTALFAPHREHSLLDLILGAAPDADALLQQTLYTQPALFCIQVALVQLYRQFNIHPDLVVGHSIGEVAGVWAAGGLSLDDAVVLVEARSRLMQTLQPGAMAAVKADVDTVLGLLRAAGSDCEIAASNSPLDTTITGSAAALARTCEYLRQHEIQVSTLPVSHAFHSRHMETVQQEFAAAIAHLEFRATNVPVLANLDAAPLDHATRGAAYWVEQLRAPVQFMQGLRQALSAGGGHCVEIGPAAVLCSLGRTLDGSLDRAWIPSLRKGHRDARVFADALATLFTVGVAVDWSGAVSGAGRRTHLPTYPWQRQRCWIDPDPQNARAPVADPLMARPLVLPRLGQQLYSLDYTVETLPVLAQHRVFGIIVPPAALYVSQLLHTAADFCGQRALVLGDIDFIAPMLLGDGLTRNAAAPRRTVQILFTNGAAGAGVELSSQPADFRLASPGGGDEHAVQVHVSAELQPATHATAAAVVDIVALQRRCSTPMDPGLVAAHMRTMDVELGESFLCFSSISRAEGRAGNEALALLTVPRTPAARVGQGVPAGLIDCHWQTLLAALPSLPPSTIVPARIDTLVWYGGELPDQVWAHAQIHEHSATRVVATVMLMTASGRVLLESRGIELRAVDATAFRHSPLSQPTASPRHALASMPRLFTRRWEKLPLPTAAAAHLPVGTICLAGNAAAVHRFAGHLRDVGCEALSFTDPQTAAKLAERGRAVPLIYVDDVDAAGAAVTGAKSCIALNRFLVLLATAGLPVSQILVVTGLTEPAADARASSAPTFPLHPYAPQDTRAAALSLAERAALLAQAAAAAHELPEWKICAVEMDQHASSIQALLAVLGTELETGLRLRISGGTVSTLQAALPPPVAAEVSFAADKLQVITGGLGGLGLLTARWMLQRGARRFLLAGRSAPAEDAELMLAELRQQGAKLEVHRCDVGDQEQVRALAARAARMGPVETVLHAAGGGRDGLIAALQDDDFAVLMQAKAIGAVNLQAAFAGLGPRYTVFYSSIAGWLGAAGQTNYCAANAALDGLAAHYADQHADQRGTTLSVAWGPWNRIGMTAALGAGHLARISDTGYGFLDADAAFSLLGRCLAAPFASAVAIVAADIERLSAMPGGKHFWSAVSRNSARPTATAPAPRARVPALAAEVLALERRAAGELLREHLARLVAEMTHAASAAHVELDAGFLDMGVDSLAALELRKRLETLLGLKLKSTLILDHPNIDAMAHALVVQVNKTHGIEISGHGAGSGTGTSSERKATTRLDKSELLRQLASEIDLQE
ncbi:MAG TPA: SDR family NAD(P)-dependent oxidoreductase [Pseudomonadales bacterium]